MEKWLATEKHQNSFDDIMYVHESDTTRTDVPEFQVYHRRISSPNKTEEGKNVFTVAIQISTIRPNAEWLQMLLLKTAVDENGAQQRLKSIGQDGSTPETAGFKLTFAQV